MLSEDNGELLCSRFLAGVSGKETGHHGAYLLILPGMVLAVLANLSLQMIRGPAFLPFTHGTVHVSLGALLLSCDLLLWLLFLACLLWTACLIEGKSSAFLITGSPALS